MLFRNGDWTRGYVAPFVVIFLATFSMVSLVSRASTGFVVVVMALLWVLAISKSTGSGSIGEVIDSAIHKSLDKAMGQFIEVLTEKTKQFQNAIQTSVPAVEVMEASDVPTRTTPDSGHRSVAAAVDEYVDRERQKQNLIIHNLPEPSDCTDTVSLEKDLQQVSSLLTSEFGVPENIVSKPTRLGALKATYRKGLRSDNKHMSHLPS